MNIGNIVEYIDQQKIICAVVLQIKNQRLRLLTEHNREVNLTTGRVSHISGESLDITANRDSIVRNLKQIATLRQEMSNHINIKELWELLHKEEELIDLETMTSFCFDPPQTPDHESSVIRAFFNDKLYFKFSHESFTPNSEPFIEMKLKQIEETEKKERLIEQGAIWFKELEKGNISPIPDHKIKNILQDYYIYEKESKTASDARAIMAKNGTDSTHHIFNHLVKAGIWHEDENIDLIRLDIPVSFPESVSKHSKSLIQKYNNFIKDSKRRDLRHLPLITIDGQSTLDFDDAISLQKLDNGYILGIHIIDVGFYIKDGDPIDIHARTRGSSIYMPDDKIPMLPPELSEGVCSLKEQESRPGISTLVRLNRFFDIIDYEIVASIIQVHHQMTYTEANIMNGEDDPITTLYRLATVLRDKRLKAGAVHITLPEINIWVEDNGEIGISRIDRENPSRMLISEFMILANTFMAEFLVKHNMPAIFRSQPDPKQRLFHGIEPSIFLNCMQRKQLNRAIIGTTPENHSGLGVRAYLTATSPIRRYYDLLTQRQIRGVLGYERPYSKNELNQILQIIEIPVNNTGKIQTLRRKYWLLRYLEKMKGCKEDAIVLDCRRDFYTVLLKEYMLEWKMPAAGLSLKPGDIIHVTIQHADARRDILSLFA